MKTNIITSVFSLPNLQHFPTFPVSYPPVNNITEPIPDDKHLVSKVLAGDSRAFGIIIKNTEKLVAQIVFKMVPVEEDRKDMAQDIYLKAYKRLAGFRFQAKLSTWIAQIAYNTCIDYLEKKKFTLVNANEKTSSENEQEEMLDILNTRANRMATQHDMARKDLSAILNDEMNKLSPVFRTIITLYHNEEMSYEEIGQIMDLPEGTVKSYLFRARKKLKENLLLTYKKEDLC
jgi:RNA polymerase sigma factor (sigma-70 family)